MSKANYSEGRAITTILEERSVPFVFLFVFCYLADAKCTFISEKSSGKNDQFFVEKLACVAGVKKRVCKSWYHSSMMDMTMQLLLS